ncbi:MAG: ABC transporter ATP-binding protein [Myxococcota bacterium]
MSQTQSDSAQPSVGLSDLRLLVRLWPHARPDAWAFGIAVLVTPLVAATNLVQPLLFKQAIDEHIVPKTMDGLDGVALMYLGALIAAYILQATYTLALAWGGTRTLVRLRAFLYEYLLARPQSFFDRRPAGMLLTRLTNDIDSLGEALTAGSVTIILDLLTIISVVVMMFVLNAELTVVLLLLSPLLFLALELLRRQMRVLFLEIRTAISAVNAYLAERIDGVEIVQLYADEERTNKNFDVLNRRFRDATTTSNVYDAFMYAMVDGVASIFIAVMLWYGSGALTGMGIPVTAGEAVSAGLLMAFIDYLNRLFTPIRELSGKIAVIQRAIAALSKIFSLLEDDERDIDGAAAVPELRGHLQIQGLKFRYRDDAPYVLNGMDLEVKPGEVVAVVGSSGSGKTTLTRLLDKSYAGYEGSITVDGLELSALSPAALRQQIAAVRQDIQVFSDTLTFNVDLDNAAISAERREEAAALVHANRFVARLGWDHVLRERGADLSVGEGQLLTFARAMAHEPALVILDEATASVDSLTEALIQDAIARILERKTVIVIAHRLSTIQNADRIAVMEKGIVVEQGSHAELMALGGRYAHLVESGRAVVGVEASPSIA